MVTLQSSISHLFHQAVYFRDRRQGPVCSSRHLGLKFIQLLLHTGCSLLFVPPHFLAGGAQASFRWGFAVPAW